MSDWLSNLDAFYNRRQPFVVATVTSYHGSSPDLPGACVFYSERTSANLVSSEHRHQLILHTAKTVLSSRKSYLLEKIPLGKVATSDNGHCDVLYEFFQATEYPNWLKQLRENHQNSVNSILVRQFNGNTQTSEITTSVVTNINNYNAVNIDSFLQTNDECQLVSNNSHLVLLRKIFNTNIPITIIGDHPVASQITNAVTPLPVDLQQIHSTECHSDNLSKVPSDSYVVIMTGDHKLDYHCCLTLLKRSDLAFVGCIGSDRKAELFKQQLSADGMTKAQLSQLLMPVGVKEINGKQTSVVATSILAQILSLYEW